MARIKYSSIVSEVSGSIGSATFQKSQFGNTLRSKPNPRRSSSPDQVTCRRYMTILHNAWSTLTSDQRTAWNRFISFSNSTIKRDRAVLLSGHSLFIKYNFLRLLSGFAVLTDVVYVAAPVWPRVDSIGNDVGTVNFTMDIAVDHDVIWFIAKFSAPRPASQSFTKQGLRYFNIIPATASGFNVTDFYQAIFGTIPAGNSFVNIECQFFSVLAPLYTNVIIGNYQVVLI